MSETEQRDINQIASSPRSNWIVEEWIKEIKQRPGIYSDEEIGLTPNIDHPADAGGR